MKEMTPREKSIRHMYLALMNGRTVKVKFSWMTARFYWYECCGRGYIASEWHGRTACRDTLTAFRDSIRVCSAIGENFKRGRIPFTVED